MHFLQCVIQVLVQVKGPHQGELLFPTGNAAPETHRQLSHI